MMRGESEGLLRVHILPENDEEAYEMCDRQFVRGNSEAAQQVALATHDSYKRLLSPSIETEFYKQRMAEKKAEAAAKRAARAEERQTKGKKTTEK